MIFSGANSKNSRSSRRRYIETTIWKDVVERMRKFEDFLEEQMQDQEFKKEYDDLQPEFDVIRAIVDARMYQNLTQKQLADGIEDRICSETESIMSRTFGEVLR